MVPLYVLPKLMGNTQPVRSKSREDGALLIRVGALCPNHRPGASTVPQPSPRCHGTKGLPYLSCGQASGASSNDDEVEVVGLGGIFRAIHGWQLLRLAFLTSLRENNRNEKNLTEKQPCPKSFGNFSFKKSKGRFQRENVDYCSNIWKHPAFLREPAPFPYAGYHIRTAQPNRLTPRRS